MTTIMGAICDSQWCDIVMDIDHIKMLNDLESKLYVKRREVPNHLTKAIPIEAHYNFISGYRLVVKFVDDFGWVDAKALWRVWDDVEASINSGKIFGGRSFLGRTGFIFLIICNTADPEAALWINFLTWRGSPLATGTAIILDLTRHILYWQKRTWYLTELTPFLLHVGCTSAVSVIMPNRKILGVWTYSNKRWRRIWDKTLPGNLTLEQIFGSGRLEQLPTAPRSYWTITKILVVITLILAFASFVVGPFSREVSGFLGLGFVVFLFTALFIYYLAFRRMRTDIRKLMI